MDFITAIGLDIAVVATVIYCARAAAKKGFVRTVIQMVAYTVILLAASYLSRAAAPIVYDRVVEPMILQKAQDEFSLDQSKRNAALISVSPRGMLSLVDSALDSLDSVKDMLSENLNPDEIASDLVGDLADATLRPLMISAISMIGFVLLFAVFSLIANMVLSALGIINYLPVIGAFNAFLGCVVGILQGLLIVWVLAVLLKGLLHIYPAGWWIFNQSVIDQSYLFKYFVNPDTIKQLRASIIELKIG